MSCLLKQIDNLLGKMFDKSEVWRIGVGDIGYIKMNCEGGGDFVDWLKRR